MLTAIPRHNAPNTLSEVELRALWRLRTSLLSLKPTVDPEQDYRNFRAFVDASYIDRVLDSDGRPRAMFCHHRLNGSFAGQRYRLALFEYGFVEPSLRGHPALALVLGRQLTICRRLRPDVVNYFAGVGYPRSAVILARAIPDLRIDGDPSLTALEHYLIERVIERMGEHRFDRARRVFELPTIPEPIHPSWRAKHASNRILSAYEAKVPDWEQGRAPTLIGRLDGSMIALGRELKRRALTGARAAR